MLQHTPRAVTVAPPSLEIFPPLDAVVDVTADAAVVVKAGNMAVAVAVTWVP